VDTISATAGSLARCDVDELVTGQALRLRRCALRCHGARPGQGILTEEVALLGGERPSWSRSA